MSDEYEIEPVDHPSAAHVAVVGKTVMLGKLETKEDSRNLLFGEFINKKRLLPKTPTSVRYTKALQPRKNPLPMYGNDALPDCTAAAKGHAERVFSYNAGQPEDPTDADVLEDFDATGSRDEGRYMLDMLNRWRNTGFGPEKEQVYAFVQVDHKDRAEVEAALWMFGGIYTGIWLPISAQSQEKWSVTHGPDAEAGSWGGHCVWVPDFSKMRGPVCITWARLMAMTWGFWRSYVDECYAVLSPDWADEKKKAPSGFDLKGLREALASI